jgi:ABC-type multidrug transport system ATPase subunit
VIALEAVTARRARTIVRDITFGWGPGAHALVGANSDGGPLLLELIAGTLRPQAGRVRVLGEKPTDDAVRRQVAFVRVEPCLPEALRVCEVFEIASAIREEPKSDPRARLAALGEEDLARRPVHSLSREEIHGVALAEALTSVRVRVVLLEEPLVGLDPRAEPRLESLIRRRSSEGCTVVLATASTRDAAELADDQVVLRRGAVVGPSSEAGTRGAPAGARLRIMTKDPMKLLAALAQEPEIDAVARRGGAVIARGPDAMALAQAGGRAVVASGVDVIELQIEPPLEEVRAE